MDDATHFQSQSRWWSPRRPWLLVGLVALISAAIAWAQLNADHDQGIANIMTQIGVSLIVLASCLWLAIFSRAAAWIRFVPLAVVIVGVGVFAWLYQFKGFTGSMLPIFVRRSVDLSEPPAPARRPGPGGAVAGKGGGGAEGAREAGKDPPDDGPGEQPGAIETTPEDFPQFLGPQRNQIVPAAPLARDWEAQPPKLRWKNAVGRGWSGFAVVGPCAVTQEQRQDQELVICYDLKDGSIRWSHTNTVRFEQVPGGIGPRATPTIYKGRVFALGATGILNCLDLATGAELWTVNILEDNNAPNTLWGKAGSPLIVDNLVVVSAGGGDGRSLVAYRQADGERAWAGGSDLSSYASPSLGTLGGVRQILIVNQDVLVGHNAADGRPLWRFEWPGRSDANASASQAHALAGDQVFVSKGYGVGSALINVSRNEADEWTASVAAPAGGRPGWKRNVMKTKFSNVCMRGGFVYGLDEERLQCIELATGKPRWKGTRYGQGQILLCGELLIVLAEDGDLALVEAKPEEFVELTRFHAIDGEPCWNTFALCGNTLVVRNDREAACYELPLAE